MLSLCWCARRQQRRPAIPASGPYLHRAFPLPTGCFQKPEARTTLQHLLTAHLPELVEEAVAGEPGAKRSRSQASELPQASAQPAATPHMAPGDPMQLDADTASEGEPEVEQPLPATPPSAAALASEPAQEPQPGAYDDLIQLDDDLIWLEEGLAEGSGSHEPAPAAAGPEPEGCAAAPAPVEQPIAPAAA